MKHLYKTVIIIFVFFLLYYPAIFSQIMSSSNTIPVIYVPGIMGSPLYDDVNNNNVLVPDEKAWFGPQFLTGSLLLKENGIDPNGNFNIKVAPLRNDAANTLRNELEVVPMDLFKGFFENMEASGYILDDYDDDHSESENLFCFTYDWRKDNTLNAGFLSDFIDSVLSWTGSEKLNLIGHSMGGIVSKTCIRLYDKSRIKNIVFIGTPHLGAPEILTVMLKGKLFEWLNFVNEIEWPVVRLLARNLLSCYQLIPTASYFDLSINNGVSTHINVYSECFQLPNSNYVNYSQLINYLTNYQSCLIENINVGLLNSSEIFKEFIDTVDFGNIKVINIVGHNIWTIGKNRVIAGGPPLYCNTIEYSRNLNGDFTVPLRSAELINNKIFEHTYYISGFIHSDLPKSQPTHEILSGVFADPPNYNFPQYSMPPQSYKDVIVKVETESDLQKTLNLFQNYPNPFNSFTQIEYQLQSPGIVSLKIYDVLGNEIVTLVSDEKSAGIYTVNFFSEDLPSGTYFYQLKMDNYMETKKMILLR